MREYEFKSYLLHQYRGPRNGRELSRPAARDAASRGARIERVLDVCLDRYLDGSPEALMRLIKLLNESERRFEIDGILRTGMSSIKNAAKRYHDFRAWEKHGNG